MADLNVVALTGRIAKASDLYEKGDLRVARLELAVEAMRKNRKSGELETHRHLFNVAVFGNPAKEAAALRPGTRVAISGRLSRSGESVEVTTGEWVRPIDENPADKSAAAASRTEAVEPPTTSSDDEPLEPLAW